MSIRCVSISVSLYGIPTQTHPSKISKKKGNQSKSLSYQLFQTKSSNQLNFFREECLNIKRLYHALNQAIFKSVMKTF